MRVNGPIGAVITAAAPHGLVDVVSREPNLEDVFLAQYGEPCRSTLAPHPMTAGARRPRPARRLVAGHGPRDDLRARRSATAVGRRSSSAASPALFMFGTGAPYGARPSSRTVELRAPVHRRHHRAAARPPRAARRAHQHRDAGRVPVLARRQHPAGAARAVAGHRPVRARSPARPPRAASTCSRRRRRAAGRSRSRRWPATSPRSSLAMLLLGRSIWVVGAAFASLPGDEIPFDSRARPGRPVRPDDAGGRRRRLRGGAVRRADPGAGVRADRAVRRVPASYSYASLSPVIDALSPLSFFTWTAGHRPMAGVTDWPSVALLAAVDRRCCWRSA